MTTEQNANIINKIMVCHSHVDRAMHLMERCYRGALEGGDARGLAVIGESGSGKSKILKYSKKIHSPHRDADGRKVPVLLASVPSKPTVMNLVEELLYEIGDNLYHKGTEAQKTKRLRKFLRSAETRILALDEFQHFVDQSSHKIQHEVADWLKILVEKTGVSLVVAGLPRLSYVIKSNEQLERRFQAPAIMPRFNWAVHDDQVEFRSILDAMQEGLSSYSFPCLSEYEMAFRVYCATGGLIGRVANLFKEVIANSYDTGRTEISLEDLAVAALQASYDLPSEIKEPFSRSFKVLPSEELITEVMKIGAEQDLPPEKPKRRRKPKTMSHVTS
ncbi:TniB family NTP-binding protein [Thiohalobacter thiocyanaticus]|uniref:Transposase n=1 Tax=Thiohalobacter thiocyanaticus TaxID=585455 RepID=A0A426QKH4_9GAMM|nr:TniB family NTP-binding protein [Thiohalobacter thiocyanaticus]RRQ22252.1 transposase [Thiohalobacter thiocyanaticus]